MTKTSIPLFSMNGDEILELMQKVNTPYVKGIMPAARILGVSRATLCRMKKAGKLDGTFFQSGRIILFDRKALCNLASTIETAP